MTLPDKGRAWSDVRAEMISRGAGDARWRDGRTALYVFNAGDELAAVQREAYGLYMMENGLGPAAFPSLAQMEKDVVATGLELLQAPAGAAGSMTSGGSESIFMAIKTARDHARAEGRVKSGGNIVIPRSGHLAFDKAAHVMDLEVRRVPVAADGSFIADAEAMAEACDARTILLMGSVPSFPFGTVDPIAALSEIALEKKIWLHVDACVGGWFAPFARMNGVPVPDFDFALPGVCSISADLHKFAFAAKGASTVLFRSLDLHRHMAFEMSGWSGAPMKTPTLAGTRPGGAIAAAWAMLQVLGKDGYQRLHGLVCETRSAIEAALRQRGFEILGRPLLPIVAFRHPDFEALALTSELRKRGWFTSMNTDPPSLHLMLSPKHAEVVNDYLTALDASMQALRTGETAGRIEVRYS